MSVPNTKSLSWLSIEMQDLCEKYRNAWNFYQSLVKNPNIRRPNADLPNEDCDHIMVKTWDNVLEFTDKLNLAGYNWDNNPANLNWNK